MRQPSPVLSAGLHKQWDSGSLCNVETKFRKNKLPCDKNKESKGCNSKTKMVAEQNVVVI